MHDSHSPEVRLPAQRVAVPGQRVGNVWSTMKILDLFVTVWGVE